MRWFVEVSRVGESGVADEYCVEAKQWQAALQEVRRLRGNEAGALSQFSIELLDYGYRAIDPALRLRYLVTRAPDDAALSRGSTRSAAPTAALRPSKPPNAEAVALTSVVPPASGPSSSLVLRPSLHNPPRPSSTAPPRPGSSAPPRSSNGRASTQPVLVPDDPVPPAPRAPGALAPELPSSPGVVAFVPPPEVAVLERESKVPLAAVPAAESESSAVPSYELIRARAEEPRADSPITYRELALAVAPGASRGQVEALLKDRYQAVRAQIEDRPAGKFIQLAVFDHAFKRRPERAPLGTFVWKDWRGEPVTAYPGFGEAPLGPLSQVPAGPDSPPSRPESSAPSHPSPSAPSSPASEVPSSGVTVSRRSSTPSLSLVPPPPVGSSLAAPEPVAPFVDVPGRGSLVPLPMVIFGEPPAPASAPDAAPAAARPEPEPAASAAGAVETASALGFDLHFDSAPINAAPPVETKSSPSRERASRPRLAVGRRRAGEDLIGELFEFMHELHFQRDFATGADFVLSVLDEVLPCEGVLIHVFDINTGHFVVVRAKGPHARDVLLQRMPDQDPLARSVMGRPHALSVPDASHDPRFNGPRWQAVGIAPQAALCGPVQQGRRYLGLIELVNPQGGAPFHVSELNALDYICEQFAEFLSQKPLVLAADVVLARV